MRTAIVFILLLFFSGCKGCRRRAEVDSISIQPPAASDPIPDLLAPTPTQPVLDLSPAQGWDLGQPSSADIRAALDPVFGKIALCVAGDMAPSGKMELRFRVAPSGEVTGAKLVGLERANECVWNVLKLLHFKSWQGGEVIASIPLEKSGLPVALPNSPVSGHD